MASRQGAGSSPLITTSPLAGRIDAFPTLKSGTSSLRFAKSIPLTSIVIVPESESVIVRKSVPFDFK